VSTTSPIFLFTDFGSNDIYVGQMKAVLHEMRPASAVIDLCNDAPNFAIESSAHLLAALAKRLPANAVTVAVVDPGVGGARDAIAIEADGRWYVGPDNGLLSVLAARATDMRVYALRLPAPKFASFHGRDLFAPAAARIAGGGLDAAFMSPKAALDVQFAAHDLPQIIYIDHYGNALTGLTASQLPFTVRLLVNDRVIRHARVFSLVAAQALFWYENSIGLVEIAANQASAQSLLGLKAGHAVIVQAS
jgi:S-adenosyl-L-methionine hydrolase (adenosine-forming)